ncbi:MAG TPA: SRPBCC family protein [Rhizomicrobium sp.]|jgi:uncharacterized protein YndB with AHSA1/START domain
MNSFVYVTYIQATPQKVWDAITKPDVTRQFWMHTNDSDWKAGSDWRHTRLDGDTVDVQGKVLESDPPKRLIISWFAPHKAANPELHSRVQFDISEHKPGIARLEVSHTDLQPDVLNGVSIGWPQVLSNMKSLLETGKAASMW